MNNEYRAVELRDSYDGEVYLTLMLNNKHTIEEVQKAINRAKEKRQEDINKYGDDWTYISEELEKDGIDWYELYTEDDYLEY